MMLGLITGVTLAFIAVSFPLLLPLMGGADVNMRLVMLAYASGFVGCLLSPVHLCLVLSRQYFKADLAKVVPPSPPSVPHGHGRCGRHRPRVASRSLAPFRRT